jgi:hypothetical protein
VSVPTQHDHKQHNEQSQRLLEQIDRLDSDIEAAAGDKKLYRRLERDKARLCREFAIHLRDDTVGFGGVSSYEAHGREVVPYWRVDGVPSKKRKGEARIWMAAHGIDWDGSALPLRHEARKALERGEHIPNDRFGLHVEWTVRIEPPNDHYLGAMQKLDTLSTVD